MRDQPQAMPETLWLRSLSGQVNYFGAESQRPFATRYVRADIAEARQSEQSARIRLFADAGRRLSKCTEVAQLKREAAGLFSLIGLNGTPFEAVIDGQQARITALEDALRACTCHPDDNPPRPCARRYALTDCREAAAAKLLDQPK